ncbi:MAG: hypothetical protein IKZ13_07775 [Akkermansia sp.]|nr:hypothetical protein [Akkermansia sp.]
MALNIQQLKKHRPVWFRENSVGCDVVLGVMGRLVRNLPGHAFPGWSTAEGRRAVADILLPAILRQTGFKTADCAEMPQLDYATRRAILERRQISPCMAARQDGCYLLINKKQDTVIMVNEEEHLAIHSFVQGKDFDHLLALLERLPQALSRELSFAENNSTGYLTSLPGEAGEGIQLYAVLHLPAMSLSNMMPQINRSIEKLQLNIAPFYPHLGEECGNMYVIYTNPAPQGALEDILNHLNTITDSLVAREYQVRDRLKEMHDNGEVFPSDRINRSYALLRYAPAISQAEWVDALSLLKLGISLGFISSETRSADELLAELTALQAEGGDYSEGCDLPPRAHPREATLPEKRRSTIIQPFIHHTTLHTAPRV